MQNRTRQTVIHCVTALALSVAFAACAVTDDAPAAPAAIPSEDAEETVSQAEPSPDEAVSTILFECTTTGRWWATREACNANCAGGVCIVCAAGCQN
jgi:uncharacterized cupin superfamily protein